MNIFDFILFSHSLNFLRAKKIMKMNTEFYRLKKKKFVFLKTIKTKQNLNTEVDRLKNNVFLTYFDLTIFIAFKKFRECENKINQTNIKQLIYFIIIGILIFLKNGSESEYNC